MKLLAERIQQNHSTVRLWVILLALGLVNRADQPTFVPNRLGLVAGDLQDQVVDVSGDAGRSIAADFRDDRI